MDIPPAGSTLGAERFASDRMVTCRYAGKDQEVMDFLVAQGSTQVEIPQSVLTAHGGGLYIESMIHSKIAKQQADIEQETAERAVLEARTAQQKAASVAAEKAAAEEKEQERQRLRAEWELELKNKIGSMAPGVMNAAAAIQGRAEVIDNHATAAEQRIDQKVADAAQTIEQQSQMLAEALKTNGKLQTDLYAVNQRIESLEKQLARLFAERN